MRRRMTVVICALLAFSMCGCDKVRRYREKKESDAAKLTEETTIATETEESVTSTPTPTPEPTQTPTPTPSPIPTNTPTPTNSPTPTMTPTPAPVIVIEGEKETQDKYSTCTVTHVRTQKSWRYEGMSDIITFSNDRATIDITGKPDASALINDTLLFINKQTETLFSNLMETVEIPAFPEQKKEENDEDPDQERSGGKKNDDQSDNSSEPPYKAVVYNQSLDVSMCLDKIIGFRYSYTLNMPDGRRTDYSEYMLFDLRDGRFVSVEDLGRTAGAFGDHLFLVALTLYTDMYPDVSIEENAFAQELNNVRYSYSWDIVEKDGKIVFRFWYPANAFANLGLEDKVFEADLDQVSMYMTSYARNLFTKEEGTTEKSSGDENGKRDEENKNKSGSRNRDDD